MATVTTDRLANHSEGALKGASILVIDSDHDFRLRIKRALSNAGFERVKVSESISSMVSNSEGAEVDIVVSDLNLVSNGKEALMQALQRCNSGKSIPIIAIGSNLADVVQAGRAHQEYADYVLKSTAPTLLASRIMDVLKRPPPRTDGD